MLADVHNHKMLVLYEMVFILRCCDFGLFVASMQQQEGSLKLAESFHLLLCCVEHVIWMVLPPMLHSPFCLWQFIEVDYGYAFTFI